jgi:hypothetical protein
MSEIMPEGWLRQMVAKPVYMAVSGIVWKGPCLLVGWNVSAVTNSGSAALYDGMNTAFSQKYRITLAQDADSAKSMRTPVYFEQGLYVNFDDTNTTGTFEIIGLPF